MRRTNIPAVLDRSLSGKTRLRGLRVALRAMFAVFAVFVGVAAMPIAAFAELTASPPGAEEYIIWPSDGAVIHGGKLWVRMGLRHMGVCPKGVAFPNTGHHHLLIDTDLPALDQEIPSDRNHLHFGAGETDARIELPPGKHTLQLILGDHHHVPHSPPVYSKKITITVQKD